MHYDTFGKTGHYLLPERFEEVFPDWLYPHLDSLLLSQEQLLETVFLAVEELRAYGIPPTEERIQDGVLDALSRELSMETSNDYSALLRQHQPYVEPTILRLARIVNTYFPVHLNAAAEGYYVLGAKARNRAGFLQIQLSWGDDIPNESAATY
jgi:hypothetical protein